MKYISRFLASALILSGLFAYANAKEYGWGLRQNVIGVGYVGHQAGSISAGGFGLVGSGEIGYYGESFSFALVSDTAFKFGKSRASSTGATTTLSNDSQIAIFTSALALGYNVLSSPNSVAYVSLLGGIDGTYVNTTSNKLDQTASKASDVTILNPTAGVRLSGYSNLGDSRSIDYSIKYLYLIGNSISAELSEQTGTATNLKSGGGHYASAYLGISGVATGVWRWTVGLLGIYKQNSATASSNGIGYPDSKSYAAGLVFGVEI